MTSGPCMWMPKPQSSSEPCAVEHLVISKTKPPSSKKRKRTYTWLQNIDFDPRNPKHRKVSSQEKVSLTKRLSAVDDRSLSKSSITGMNDDSSPPSSGKPVILPLLRKLYLKKDDSCKVANNGTCNANNSCYGDSNGLRNQLVGILGQKVAAYLKKTSEPNSEQFLNDLTFSDKEINMVEEVTREKWQCGDWYMHKVGFITASKCKDVYSRQSTLDKKSEFSVTALAKSICTKKVSRVKAVADNPKNPRDWGLKNEDSARNSYLRVQKHLHYKAKLIKKGFVISKAKPFVGTSVDNIRSCDCACKCKDVVVEYKCPWVHRDLDPKEAFLTKEIGGVKLGKKDSLKANAKYYYQVQLVDKKFMQLVLLKLEKFWVSPVASLLFDGKGTLKE